MLKLLRKIIAFFRRTFVTDCPRCHLHFFGYHEYGEQIKIGKTHYRILCHRCVKELI